MFQSKVAHLTYANLEYRIKDLGNSGNHLNRVQVLRSRKEQDFERLGARQDHGRARLNQYQDQHFLNLSKRSIL